MPEEEFDYYKALKDQNYSTLLDNQIQLDNARQRALKNTNVGLAAAGFDSSGYGQLARQGIESQYLQGLQNAQANYQNQNLEVDKQQFEHKEAQANSFLSLMNNDYVTDIDSLNTVFGQRGFLNDDGSLNFAAIEKKYGTEAANDIATSYALMSKGFNTQEEENKTSENIQNILTSMNLTEKDAYDSSFGEIIRNYDDNLGGQIINYLATEAKNGDYVSFEDGRGKYYFVTYNGKLYQVDKAYLPKGADIKNLGKTEKEIKIWHPAIKGSN